MFYQSFCLYFQDCLQDDLSWSVVPNNNVSKCCAKEYSGNTCSSFLSNWQTCALGQSTSVFVHNSSLLSEDQVIEIITNISKFINIECIFVIFLLT